MAAREPQPSPEQPPTLLALQRSETTAAEASELIEAGLARAEEVAEAPSKPGSPERWIVPLRPAQLPDIVDALAQYIDGPWRAWAAEEAPRRRAIRIYEGLFKAQAQIAAAGNEVALELVIGIGLARWKFRGQTINLPLIEQRAEFALASGDGTLSILPRNVPPVAALQAFVDLDIAGAATLQREMMAELEARARDPDRPFGPFEPASFMAVLSTFAARLDARGTLLPAEEPLGKPGESLRISPGFCVLVRPRRADLLRDDLTRLIAAIEQGAPLPPTAGPFVIPACDRPPTDDVPIDLDGLNPSTSVGGGSWGERTSAAHIVRPPQEWLYFPLPANAAQEEIARRLQRPEVHGVVVQGPPGTGKTHTIANIIGHCMAKGQRILVSAHTAEALTAIRDKLPPALRDLTIAITHSDREGARQLEEAVNALAARVLNIDARATGRGVDDLERAIGVEDERVVEIAAELEIIARDNLTELPWRGGRALPEAIAAWAAPRREQHAWFPDPLDCTAAYDPRFGEAEIAEAVQLRARLGDDLRYRAEALPAGTAELPSVGMVLAMHRLLREEAARHREERDGSIPRPDVAAMQTNEPAKLIAWLERLAQWRASCGEHGWMVDAWPTLVAGGAFGRLSMRDLQPQLQYAAELTVLGDALVLQALELPESAEHEPIAAALRNCVAGRPPFGLLGRFGRSPAKDAIDAARVAGERPRQAADWGRLEELHAWRREARGFQAR